MKKTILLTGSRSALGTVISDFLEAEGFKVYRGVKSSKEVKNKYDIKLDITNDTDCSNAIKTILERETNIYALINVVGYTLVGPTLDFTNDDYIRILNTNAVGAFRLIRKITPHFKEQKEGRIINIISLNGLVSLPNFGLYSSSKFALDALGLALRYELNAYNIWVTNIIPGAIKSSINERGKLPHLSAREKFWLLKVLMPMLEKRKVAESIVKILNKSNPPARVILGNDALITYNMQRLLPLSIWDRIMLYVWNKK